MRTLSAALILALAAIAQAPPPPPPPPPAPGFMGIRGLPLDCFAKPNFEEKGVEYFVCNGGGGVAGFRRKSDPAKTIFVRDPDLAMNLNMKQAKADCGAKGFAVGQSASMVLSFTCGGTEIRAARFQADTRAPWKTFDAHLNE